MKTIQPPKESGSSLVVVLSVLATLMVVVAVAAEYTYTVNRHVVRSNTEQSAISVADSCIEMQFATWRKICSEKTKVRFPQPTSEFDTEIPTPSPGQLSLPAVTNFVKRGTSHDPEADEYDANYTISNYKVVAVNPQWKSLAGPTATPIPMLGQLNGAITTAKPTTSLVYNYVASADVTLPALGPAGNIVAKVRRVFQKQQISPWNFAIFYVEPLEIHPGPDFTVTGWVHTNADLYTGHNTLTFEDKVTYGSDWFVDFMPGDDSHPETPSAPKYPGELPPAREQALQPFGLDATALFNVTDANPNNDSYRELIEPPTATPDPLSESRYWDQADVIIQVNSSNNVVIGIPHISSTTGVADGIITPFSTLLASPGSGGLPTGSALRVKYQALSDMFSATGTITTDQTIEDEREGGNIRLVTLDLSKIQNNTSGLTPTFKATDFNGIVYIYDNSASTHALNSDGSVNANPTNPVRRGVRLKNGSKIAATGLTVVSPNPVYIQGDFNTGRDYDGNPAPPSNSGNENDAIFPEVTNYNGINGRAPCSVLGDAVTILSNAWLDSNAGDKPEASNTTVNAAIVSGIVPTGAYTSGNYSGGAENFPRFLEDWGDKALTYYGSMVQLYKSQQSIGEWSCCNVYDPPVRQWYFDNKFRSIPPPGSLMLYSYIKGKWSVLER